MVCNSGPTLGAIGYINIIPTRTSRDESNAATIRGPGSEVFPSGRASYIAERGTIGPNDIDFVVTVAIGGKSNPLAIGRPNRPAIQSGMIGEATGLGTVGIHDPDVPVPAAGAGKGNLLPIRGPTGMGIWGGFVRQPLHSLAGDIGQVNLLIAIARADKEQLFARGRNARTFFESLIGDEHGRFGMVNIKYMDVQFTIGALELVVNIDEAFAVGEPGGVKIRAILASGYAGDLARVEVE